MAGLAEVFSKSICMWPHLLSKLCNQDCIKFLVPLFNGALGSLMQDSCEVLVGPWV